jgi:hypothetical protein
MNDLLRRLVDLLFKRPKLAPVKVPTDAQKRDALNERLYELRRTRRLRNHY